jgi:hypothetical protein
MLRERELLSMAQTGQAHHTFKIKQRLDFRFQQRSVYGLLRRVIWKVLAASIIAPKIEAEIISQTSIHFYQTTQRNNPEDSHIQDDSS